MKLRFITLTMALLTLAGCGLPHENDENDVNQNDSPQVIDGTMQQAAEQADSLLDDTIDAIKPPVSWTHAQTSSSSCTDWKNESTDKGAVTRRRSVLTVISEERRGSFLGVVERHWKKQGYKTVGVNKNKESPALYVETPNGFSISLSFGYKGQAFFEVGTPCADQSDVARPKSKPNGPDYYNRKAPLPDVEDDFWSARSSS